MKYLFINSVYGKKSTGKIIAEQCHKLQSEGNECLVAYGREAIMDPAVKCIRIGTTFDYHFHGLMTRCFDLHGFCSRHATKKFLKKVEQFEPDVIWLHNLHGYYINVELLFDWIKKHPKVKVKWTLHDCWAFTGHCVYFTIVKCNKWTSECNHCPQLREYPKTLGLDNSRRNYKRKKKAFNGVQNLKIITPSKWLLDLLESSYLSEYTAEVIHNTINYDIFKPTPGDFINQYHLKGKYIILGVAVGWEQTKGLYDVLALRKLLPINQYIIVLVGISEEQLRSLPDGILGLKRTDSQTELACIYTAADVFINPTHQDNYPTVNLEAAACGTPVVTYNVGGSPESVPKENVIEENDIQALAKRIVQICQENKKYE